MLSRKAEISHWDSSEPGQINVPQSPFPAAPANQQVVIYFGGQAGSNPLAIPVLLALLYCCAAVSGPQSSKPSLLYPGQRHTRVSRFC
jgi:hypothetical protein